MNDETSENDETTNESTLDPTGTPQDKSGGGGKSGDLLKYAILIAFIAIGSYLFYVDSNVTTPETNKKLQEITNACESIEGFDSDKIQEIAGISPASSNEYDGKIKVETYVFKRFVPFLTSARLHAIYADGVLRKVVQDPELDEEEIEWVRSRYPSR